MYSSCHDAAMGRGAKSWVPCLAPGKQGSHMGLLADGTAVVLLLSSLFDSQCLIVKHHLLVGCGQSDPAAIGPSSSSSVTTSDCAIMLLLVIQSL